jgi:organic radical activating enzyme
MPEIPKTFCPAKWDELMINFSYDYVFSCCKATPIKIKNKNYNLILNEQKENLLNGVQDPSCNYCWKVENNNLPSRRHDYLKFFDQEKFQLYKTNAVVPKLVDVYIGNECNFQCTYCNPKFSSQWEADVKKKSYKIFTDRHFYGLDDKNKEIKSHVLDTIKDLDKSTYLTILGGEPLLNKFFWQILDLTSVANFSLSTNLSCQTKKEIDKLKDMSYKFDNMFITVSIDSTGRNAEFTRHGLDFEHFQDNFDYLLNTLTPNMHVGINSVMSSITIQDLANFLDLVKSKKKMHQDLTWTLNPCTQPRIQSFDTLIDQHKNKALDIISEIKTLEYVRGADLIESSLLSSKFNNTLYQELKHFLNEFAERKGLSIPVCLN